MVKYRGRQIWREGTHTSWEGLISSLNALDLPWTTKHSYVVKIFYEKFIRIRRNSFINYFPLYRLIKIVYEVLKKSIRMQIAENNV